MSLSPQKLIAGPCSAETRGQTIATAEALKGLGIKYFRAGLWKPRSRPGSFEGVGAEGLEWLREVKDRFAMKVCTEVATPLHAELCLKAGVDILWVGARTTANPFQVQELAEALRGCGVPVLVKNPPSHDIALWLGALERLQAAGTGRLAAVLRGVPSSEKIPYRNAPDWELAVEMRTRLPELPVFADPSHIAGGTAYIKEISQRALDLGFDGLMIESHIDPSSALSDPGQQLTPAELGVLLASLQGRDASSPDERFLRELEALRARMDVADEDLIAALAARMKLSAQIGALKKEHKVAIIQTARWEKVLSRAESLAREYGLDPEAARGVFDAVHEASIKEQNR